MISIIKPRPAPTIVGQSEPVSGTGNGVADPAIVAAGVDAEVEVDFAVDVAVDLDVLVAVVVADCDVEVEVAVAVAVDKAVDVDVAVAVAVAETLHSVKLVVQAPPAEGQQYCFASVAF